MDEQDVTALVIVFTCFAVPTALVFTTVVLLLSWLGVL